SVSRSKRSRSATFVRGASFDLHSSNIVLRRGQPVIIDLGDLSRGSHWFDVALRFTIYGVPDLGLSKLACGIPVPYGLRLCNAFERRSMADFGSAVRACFEENRFVLASLRLLCAFEIAPARKPWFLETTRTALGPGIRSPTRR
ncbi:MAG: hypothetical protein ACO3NL_01970, partial [Phycisphaerales bacterium]